MRNSVANTPLRDRFLAQWCLLLAAIAAFALGLPGSADARSKGRQTDGYAPVAAEPARTVAANTVVASAAMPVSLRAANDLAIAKPISETPTGTIRGRTTVGKVSARMSPVTTMSPVTATADAVVDPLPSAAPQRPKDWYPESHGYLRPYHYKWRYWTPG